MESLLKVTRVLPFVRGIVFLVLTASLILVGISIAGIVYIYQRSKSTVYFVDAKGAVYLGKEKVLSLLERRIEARHHIEMFHEGFFTIDQFNYQQRINRSLYLIGETGKDLYKTLKANGTYAKIITNNLEQVLEIDSIMVNVNTKPYTGAVFGHLFIKRTDSNEAIKYDFSSAFNLYEVSRNDFNPHGLLIDQFVYKLRRAEE